MSFSFSEGPIHKQQIPNLDFLPPANVDGSNPGVDEANQAIHVALIVASELAKVCGRPDDLVNISIVGHTNYAHAPDEGWADEAITVSIMVADTTRGALGVAVGDVNVEADLDTGAVEAEVDVVAAADQAAVDHRVAVAEGASPQADAVVVGTGDGEPKAQEPIAATGPADVALDPTAVDNVVEPTPVEPVVVEPVGVEVASPAPEPTPEVVSAVMEAPPVVLPDGVGGGEVTREEMGAAPIESITEDEAAEVVEEADEAAEGVASAPAISTTEAPPA